MHAKEQPEKSAGPRSLPNPTRQTTARAQPAAGVMSAPVVASLQRTVGNAAVARMIGRRRGTGCRHEQELAVQRSAVHDVLRSAGQPLDEGLRTEMEARFGGVNFSDVRVHADAAARRSAGEIDAQAYTSGSHIVVGEGGVDKHTLAHELTHVVQQRRGPVAGSDTGHGLRVSDPSDRFEREAEATARRVMSGPVSAQQHTDGPAPDSAAHDHGHAAVQRLIEFGPNADDGSFELQLTPGRPAWEPTAQAMANNAGPNASLNHIIPFERIQRDLDKHANFLFDARGTTGWQSAVAAFEANCDALFTNGSPEHTAMVQRRNAVINALNHPFTRTQRAPVEAAIQSLLSALNSSSQNLRIGDASLNASIGNAIDADFLPGTIRHTGAVFTDSPPPSAVPLPNQGGAQATHTVTNLECVRLTPQHESHVFAYSAASPSSLKFTINGLAGVLHHALQNGQHMSSTQAPTAVAPSGTPPYPVLVMDPNGIRAPFLFYE